jgi:hypothetical protein
MCRVQIGCFLLLASCLGCAPEAHQHILFPWTIGPRDAQQQKWNAERWDPFPEEGPGPSVTGARPREFQKAAPEAIRTQPRLQYGPPYAPPMASRY